jgi:hypothetical protein
MWTFDTRDSRSLACVQHGVTSNHPQISKVTLADALKRGLCTDPVSIIRPEHAGSFRANQGKTHE